MADSESDHVQYAAATSEGDGENAEAPEANAGTGSFTTQLKQRFI